MVFKSESRGWRKDGAKLLRAMMFALAVSNIISTESARAAQISETGTGPTTVGRCSLTIEGQVANGDAARVEEVLKRNLGSPAKHNSPDAERRKIFIVCLSGPGGSYLEGIRLGELFARYGVATAVPDRARCESACAIAFLGGRACCDAAKKPVVQRYLFPGSRIGFHAPSLNLKGGGEYSRESAFQAFDLGLEAVARLRRNAKLFSINDIFMSEIFDHRGQDFFYIRTLDQAEANKMLLVGYKPRRLKPDTYQAACWNAWYWYVVKETRKASFMDDKAWRSVFKGAAGHYGRFPRGSKIYEFYPFDGSAYCQVREARRNGRRMLQVVISEGDVATDPDPRLKGFFRPTLLMRGNRTLESTR